MGKYLTWFDVEHRILQSRYSPSWPKAIVGASVYSDELEILVKSIKKDKVNAIESLKSWFGGAFSPEEQKIYLESPGGGEKRFLPITFIEDPDEEFLAPKSMKPYFSNFILYPESPDLEGPDFSKLRDAPSLWAFYSFKGGVGRTLHLLSLVKAISETHPDQKVLIVDADLEAPGLTWWAEKQMGKPGISFLDFLALTHYDRSVDLKESMTLSSELIRSQMLEFETKDKITEHFFLPAFKDISQSMRMPIRPEHICWEPGKEWIIPELLWKLGKTLDVDSIIVDLRAGMSEISSPLLFDPRVNRVIVTTPSGQSAEGTQKVLEQLKKITPKLQKKFPDYANYLPLVILSMIKEDIKDAPDLHAIREKIRELILPEEVDATDFPGKEVIIDSMFDENLIYLKDLEHTIRKLDGTSMHEQMLRVAREWISPTSVTQENGADKLPPESISQNLKKLEEVAEKYEYAEMGGATEFMITPNLKAISRKFQHTMPVAVIMGAKGSGKTYTYLQLTQLKEWSRFTEKVLGETGSGDGYIWPLLTSHDLEAEAKNIIHECRNNTLNKLGTNFSLRNLPTSEILDYISKTRQSANTDKSAWRKSWFSLMATVMGCETSGDPLRAMQQLLSDENRSIVFQIDGLEYIFQNTGEDPVEQTAIEVLCRDVANALREWPDNRIGLIVFIRKDLAKSSIRQNFGQFEALYRNIELRWDWEEALRLVAWLVKHGAGLEKYVRLEKGIPLESVPKDRIEEALIPLWGLKLGSPNSREAYRSNWVITVLSDFNSQLQARDVVRLIKYASNKASKEEKAADRLLSPTALRNALDPCSEKKIEELKTESSQLKKIFTGLSGLPDEKRRVPLSRSDSGLTTNEIEFLKKMGMLYEEEGNFYFPEIIRRGLDLKYVERGRSKVISLLKKARNN